MSWFDGCDNVAQVKSVYRALAKQYHPDVSGYDSTATMQQINAAYHAKLQSLDGQTTTGTDGREHRYYYREQVEQAVIDKIAELLGLRLPVTIELVGTWVWVHGDTRPHREALKAAKLRWHGQREMWYWRPYYGPHKKRYSGIDFNTLRAVYGARTFDREESTAVAA